ncbi:hypothetical protein [Pseudomonas fluorescens]|uniref:hypothetical protein n=1 Tax=Pseudomonas fluorescens TaxID=294 RepID=UPI00123F5480|nr:hypothetical protein [Pseudomonas fluorescens]
MNRATVLEHQQRQADIAALTALNARLQSRDAVQHLVGPRVLAQWQSLSGAITAVQSVQLTRARFESGQWRLELQAPTRTDIQPLLQHWQALGLTIQLGAALDGVQGVTLPVLLEVATK